MTSTSQSRTKGRKRLVVAAGSVLAAAALVTTAAFTDIANLNIRGGASDSGFGGGENNSFNIQVVATDADGNKTSGWQEADTAEGVDILFPGADTMAPGDTPITLDVPFKNASPALAGDFQVTLQDVPGKTSDALIKENLQFEVLVDGTSVASGNQAALSSVDLGEYAAGEEGVLTIKAHIPDQGENNNAFQNQNSYVQIHLDASSVQAGA